MVGQINTIKQYNMDNEVCTIWMW